MSAAVGTALTTLIGYVGEVIQAISGSDGKLNELLPLFAIGVAISVVLVATKIIRKIIWGA